MTRHALATALIACCMAPACTGREPQPPCEAHADCVLVPVDQCDCSYDRDTVRAVHRSTTDWMPGTGCGTVCLWVPDPSLQPACDLGECVVVDVAAEDSFTACEDDSACTGRAGECCECGPSVYGTHVALRTDALAAYSDLVCSGVTSCDPCPSPERPEAHCEAGRCTLTE